MIDGVEAEWIVRAGLTVLGFGAGFCCACLLTMAGWGDK